MQTPPKAGAATEIRTLAVAIAWMLLVQFGCVLLWEWGILARQAALLHWLVVGVLPPALALWSTGNRSESV
ncbi:hypothetical protein JYK14_12320 [Siccirubricoccus sp. KC 17139]|uniref:Uncharacterized protein n=1 Tax=Siccirubricoccus soli TaxID=2899147 RepID=A0ABT1D7H7_9PROT|nr:hypothetical protein [Siccirubricoccus soli]MCO6416940.1 hypothetical protein [Siccirubricoccus soli]MCP2683075.1 hypothetical protein [Siccirubricoccus soli]